MQIFICVFILVGSEFRNGSDQCLSSGSLNTNHHAKPPPQTTTPNHHTSILKLEAPKHSQKTQSDRSLEIASNHKVKLTTNNILPFITVTVV